MLTTDPAALPAAPAPDPIRLGRRNLLALPGGGALALTLPATASADLPPKTVFRIQRGGSVIGTHELHFAPLADGIEVQVEVEIAVKAAFVTVFRYEQHAVDRWQNGILIATDVRTNNNGVTTRLAARVANSELRVDGPERGLNVALGTMTDLLFWNPAIIRQPAIIDTVSGGLTQLTVGAGRKETVRLAGRAVEVTRHSITTTRGSGDVRYDAQGRWIGGQLRCQGETLDYELVT
jgi:Family of unknown function (DUF6134)